MEFLNKDHWWVLGDHPRKVQPAHDVIPTSKLTPPEDMEFLNTDRPGFMPRIRGYFWADGDSQPVRLSSDPETLLSAYHPD